MYVSDKPNRSGLSRSCRLFLLATATAVASLIATPSAFAERQAASDTVVHYYLPRAVFDLSATYEIVRCPRVSAAQTPRQTPAHATRQTRTADGAPASHIPAFTAADAPLVVRVTPTITPRAEADTTHVFTLAPSNLDSWWRTVSANFAFYDNGTIKTVSAQSEDRTGAIVNGLLGTLSSLIQIGGLAAEGRTNICSERVLDALEQKYALTLLISNPQTSAQALTGYQAQLSRIVQQELTFSTDPAPFTPTQSGSRRVMIQPTAEQWSRYFAPDGQREVLRLDINAAKQAMGDALDTSRMAALGVEFLLAAPSQPWPGTSATVPTYSDPHLILREPLRGQIFACRYLCGPEASPTPIATAPRLATADVLVPQFNGYTAVPMRAGLFQSNTLKLSLGPFGDVQSFGWDSNARAQALVQATGDASRAIVDQTRIIQDSADTREAARIRLQAGVLNAQRELIEAQQKLDAARAALGE